MHDQKRFYLLDVLRGLAALGVVVWHYQHFYYLAPAKLVAGFERQAQPFYWLLAPIYERGAYAVQLFFVLSGFVFFHVYWDRLRQNRVGIHRFTLARIARLYPLHLATLLIVAIGQAIALQFLGKFIVYPNNDAYHFALNLGFASHWGLQTGYAFNGPIWSVSVEVLLYAIFFVVARYAAPRSRSDLALAFGAAIVSYLSWRELSKLDRSLADIAYGASCFFAGGIAYLIWQRASVLSARSILAAAGTAALVVVCASGYIAHFGDQPRTLHLLVFPSAVLCLALVQSRADGAGERLSALGDISYGVYLLHFPLQLGLMLAAGLAGMELPVANTGFFAAFFVLVIATAALVFVNFERPAQIAILRVGSKARTGLEPAPQTGFTATAK